MIPAVWFIVILFSFFFFTHSDTACINSDRQESFVSSLFSLSTCKTTWVVSPSCNPTEPFQRLRRFRCELGVRDGGAKRAAAGFVSALFAMRPERAFYIIT